jgi:hypothetical protein
MLMLVSSAALCLAQVTSTVTLSNGVEVRITANLGRPTGQQVLSVEMARASGDSFYRIFKDQNNLAVFAYELGITRSANGEEFHFVAKPAETGFADKFPDADAGKPVPSLSSEHEFKPLAFGQSDEIGLFEIPGMGVAVTDKVQVAESPEKATGVLRLEGLKVSIAGIMVAGPARGSVAGRYAMFYLPKRGGFFFATEAPEGKAFVKAGTIDGTHMRFVVDNVSYECETSVPILAAGSGEVWVYFDPGYRPEGNWTKEDAASGPVEFFTAASDSLSWWL